MINNNCKIALRLVVALVLLTLISFGLARNGQGVSADSLRTTAPSSLTWAKTFGKGIAYSVLQTSEGDYIVAGYTWYFGTGGDDAWIFKLDYSGNIVWQKTYGGGNNDYAKAIIRASDGGYIVLGQTNSFGAGGVDVWVFKLDDSGNLVWSKSYGGSNDDFASSIAPTSDGGYIIGGTTYSFGAGNADYWVLKLDSSGNLSWQKAYGGTSLDQGSATSITSDHGSIVGGFSFSFGTLRSWYLKLNSVGDVAWSKTCLCGINLVSSLHTTDGKNIAAGRTGTFGAGDSDFWVIKLDESGNPIWQKSYGSSSYEESSNIAPTADGGYILSGMTRYFSNGNAPDALVIRVDSVGSVMWQRSYGGSNDDYAYAATQTADGGFIIVGKTQSFGSGDIDAWVIKTDANGNLANSCTISKSFPGSASGSSISSDDAPITPTISSVIPVTNSLDINISNAIVGVQCAPAMSLFFPVIFR